MITCTLFICDQMTTSLFYSDSTLFYKSTYFIVALDMICESLDVSVHVSILVEDFVIIDTIYRSYEVTFMIYKTWVDLVILDMIDFDVILRMSWLSLYHAIPDCRANTISISMLGIS